jgi:hypothetical protein
MTLADFFLAVNGAGIRLANVGGQLQLRGPASAISPEIRAGAVEHKAAVLALLPPTSASTAGTEGAEVPDGIPRGRPVNTTGGHDRSTPDGVIVRPQGADRVASGGVFRHDHDWRDWRMEWLLEVATLFLRMRSCENEEVLARLRPLAAATPTSLAEWLALGEQIGTTEHELRQQGKLPPYPWPEGGEP